MNMNYFAYPNRTLCDTLEEMRKLLRHVDHRSVPILKSLVEEAQCLGNRMEAGLEDLKDIRELHKKKKEIKEEIIELEENLKEIKAKPKKKAKKEDK